MNGTTLHGSEWLNDLVEHSPNVVFAFTDDGTVVFSNSACHQTFPLIGNRRTAQLMMGEEYFKECLASKRRKGKLNFTRKVDGKFYRFAVVSIPAADLFACYAGDISDLLQAQEALLDNQEFLRRVIDTDPNLIFVKDCEGRFTLVNNAVAEIYGTTVEGLVGKKDSDFNPNVSEIEHFRKDDLEVINTQEEKIVLEEQVTSAQGVSRWFSTVKRPIRISADQDVQVLGVSTDITEVRALQSQLGQAQKMQALGQLAGGIAHDFNNLLTAILGHAEVLQVTRSEDRDVIRSADLIYGAGTRAQELTGQLLGFARQGKNQHTTVNLKFLVQETITLLRRTLDPTVSVLASTHGENLSILGDPTQIQQVLMNLVLNARDAVLASQSQGGKGTILCEVYERDATVDLQVSDNGCGMSEEVQKRLFEPFFTTKEMGKGTGLGLAMVYGIVENHSGKISVKSVVGAGTDVILSFPKAVTKKAEPNTCPRADVHRDAQGTILVVDDNPDVLIAVESMLHTLGYAVVICSSGEDALRVVTDDSRFVAAIVDLMMPGMDGEETIRILKDRGVQFPFILTTGYGQNNAAQRLINSDNHFIKKPYELRELQALLERVCQQVRA